MIDVGLSFDALGDPTRREILGMLAAGEKPVGAIVSALQAGHRISQPAVSQHLRVLREASLVAARADGTRRIYGLDASGLEAAVAWLRGLADPMAALGQPLDALATEVARGRRARRSRAARPARS